MGKMLARLEPIYGWGWSLGLASIDVPADFQIECADLASLDFIGRVVSSDHLLSGLALRIVQRADFGDIRTYDLIGETEGGESIVGFAQIPLSDIPPLS